MGRFEPPTSMEEIPTVDELVAHTDQHVAGLDKQKRRIALLLRRHMIAALNSAAHRPPNLLMLGPTGGGKTWMLKVMLGFCPVICAEINAPEYSDVGFRGRDLTTMYVDLISQQWAGEKGEGWNHRQMVDLAQRWGVVVIDEFDKLRIQESRTERDKSRQLQAELLKYTEGATIDIKRFDGDRGFSFRTGGVLHIAVGAFDGLSRLMSQIDHPDDPGYRPSPDELRNNHLDVEPYDLERYGFGPELVGRFATMVPLPPLDVTAFTRILLEHTLPRYRAEMESAGVELDVDDGAVAWLAGKAAKDRIGARGLSPLLEELLSEPWAGARPGDRVSITAESVQRRTALLRRAVAA